MLPAVPPAELARRIQILYPGGPLDPQIESAVAVAAGALAGHVDDTLANTFPANWVEAVTQLAVKVWDTGPKGLTGMDAAGEFTFPAPAASPGMVASVFGVLSPCMITGGNVIA